MMPFSLALDETVLLFIPPPKPSSQDDLFVVQVVVKAARKNAREEVITFLAVHDDIVVSACGPGTTGTLTTAYLQRAVQTLVAVHLHDGIRENVVVDGVGPNGRLYVLRGCAFFQSSRPFTSRRNLFLSRQVLKDGRWQTR